MNGDMVGIGGGSAMERKNEGLSYSSLAGAIFLAVPGFSKNARGKVKADGPSLFSCGNYILEFFSFC